MTLFCFLYFYILLCLKRKLTETPVHHEQCLFHTFSRTRFIQFFSSLSFAVKDENNWLWEQEEF